MTEKYLDGIIRKFKTGKTTEHSFRGDLQDFVERTVVGVQAINEPTRQKCGAPDYIIQKKNIPIGYIEAKDIDKNLDVVEKSEQLDRYRASLDNLILTNYLEFRFFMNGEHVDTVKVADIINGKIIVMSITDIVNCVLTLFKSNKSYKEIIQPEEQPVIKHFDKDSKFYKASLLLAEIKGNGKLPIRLSPVVLKSLVVIANSPDWDTKLDNESINNLNKIYEKWQRHIKNSSKNQPIVQLGAAGGFEEPQPEQIEEDETPEPNVIIYEHDLETGEFDLCENYTSELLERSKGGTYE